MSTNFRSHFAMEEESEVETMDVSDTIEEEESEDADTIEEEDESEPEQSESEDHNGEQPPKRKVYLPGHRLKNNEVLEPDSSAYVMLHEAYAG